MIFARYTRVVAPCPTIPTGGPEAIHQLAWALARIGVPCHPAYYGADNQVAMNQERVTCRPPDNAAMRQHYGHYGAQPVDDIELTPDTLVMLTEGLAHHHVGLPNCGVAVWWLSVDNAYRAYPQLADVARRRQFLEHETTVHLWQSVYARDWLREGGAARIAELGDFTTGVFTAQAPAGPSPRPTVAFNAAKGGDLAQRFFAGHPQYEGLALQGFSKAQLKAIFAERLLYVDFGHLPGKDRLPREAAAAGAIVFVRRQGAGATFDDFPLPDIFKFELEDVASGELHRRLSAVTADPQAYWDLQADFRSIVRWERPHFADTVARLWGRPPPA